MTDDISNLGGGQERIQFNRLNAIVNGGESTSLLDQNNGGLGFDAGSNQVVALDVEADYCTDGTPEVRIEAGIDSKIVLTTSNSFIGSTQLRNEP